MIRGHKPAAYFSTGNGVVNVEGEQRQCVHCQFLWTYQPGSGTRRGYCLHCDGFLCGREVCQQLQQQWLTEMSHLPGASDRHCIPYNDYIERQRDEYVKQGWTRLSSGILVAG